MPADLPLSAGALTWARGLAAAAAVTLGCSGGDHSGAERVLRVSAPWGLSSMRDLNQDVGGTNANIVSLLLDHVGQHVEVIRRDGAHVFLRPLPLEPLRAPELAASLRAPGLASVRVSHDGGLIAEFTDPQRAEMFARPRGLGFALGPYELDGEDIENGRIRLRARDDKPMDVIEFVAVDASEQWRRLHARAIDVVPSSPASTRAAYTGMTSVRLVDHPVVFHVALYLNTRNPALADPAVRRALVRLIDRRAVAAVACGTPECAVAEPSPDGTGAALPPSIRIMTLSSYSIGIDAARAIRLQLIAAGFDASLELLDIAALSERIRAGDHQLLIGPLQLGLPGLRSMKGNALTNPTGWSKQEFDDAVDAGDEATAAKLMRDDAPALRLLEDREFAAIDARFCGGDPDDYSWRWLADLHPCEQGDGR